jgi:hypothetical protein
VIYVSDLSFVGSQYLARLRLRPTRRVDLWLRSPVHDELW